MEKAATVYELIKKPQVGSKVATQAAELYLKTGDIEKAIENWSRAVAMNPENMVAHSRLALVYERLKRIPQAVREYLHIASLMQHSGDHDKAVQVVHRALKLSPDHDEAMQALAMLRDNIPLPKPARPRGGTGPIEESTPVVLEAPTEAQDQGGTPVEEAVQKALSDLAALFFEQSSEEMIEEPEHTGSLSSIVDGTGPLYARNVDKTQLMLHLGQAVEYLTGGDHDRAASELERVIDIGLHHPAAYFQLGVLRLVNNRTESAIRYLRRAVSHRDLALGSRLLMADAFLKRDLVDDSIIEYLQALKLADSAAVPPQHADGLRQLYEPLIEAKVHEPRHDGNAEICSTISEMVNRPNWRQYLQNVRQELMPDDEGPPSPLAEVLTEASSSQVVVSMGNVRRLAREGRRAAAFEEALFALQEAPTYLPLHIAIADILLSSDKISAAIEKLKVISRLYSVRGESERAIDMLQRVVDLSPMDIEARKSLIDTLVSRGKVEESIQGYINLAEVYYSMAELTQARKTYTRALRFVEQSSLGESWRIRIMHRIADIDVQSLNWRQGLTIYERILAIRPDDLDASQRLIDLNLRLGERKQALDSVQALIQTLNAENRSEDALSFLEKTVNQWPQQAMIRKMFADQCLILNRVEDAIEQLNEAREILFDSGNKEGAINMLKEIIELNPDNVNEFKQLLERMQLN
jgi:tetratricopeptide (TPR) repeat protein